MKLLTNSDCQLILEGPKPSTGLEILVYGENYTIIEQDRDSEFYFNMPEDGLFQYFVLDFTEEPEDILEYIRERSILPEAQVFSICKLRKCLLEKEREYISNFLHGCSTNSHCKNSNEDVVRDFLLSTIFVLESLICSGQTTEALRILENIKSCDLCQTNNFNSCGCNGKN
jgi:hypothetical protein